MSPAYKITYFDCMGLGESLRVLASYGGLDFEDNRVQRKDWPALKPKAPYGTMPLLEHKGKTVHQSMAIARYLAKQVKLTGKDDWEDLEIDAIADTISDLARACIKYYLEPDAELKERYGKPLFADIIPYTMAKLDTQVKTHGGYFVGGHLTWADLVFVGIIDFLNFATKKNLISDTPNLQKLKETVVAVPTVKAYMAIRPNRH